MSNASISIDVFGTVFKFFDFCVFKLPEVLFASVQYQTNKVANYSVSVININVVGYIIEINPGEV